MPSSGFDADYFDEHLRLVGDEDGGVGIECRLCNLEGQPIAYLGRSNPYEYATPAVVHADTPSALILAASRHLSNGIHYTN